jgi:hypothetical protein
MTYRSLSVSQLDTVAPYDDFTTEVGMAVFAGKIPERVGIPDPSVVDNCQ